MSAMDTRRLEVLLPAIFGLLGTDPFWARDLSDEDAADVLRTALDDQRDANQHHPVISEASSA